MVKSTIIELFTDLTLKSVEPYYCQAWSHCKQYVMMPESGAMEVGIIGLPAVGKTTIFNALTRGKADTGTYSATGPNVGVVKVPDPRLSRLDNIFHPRKKTPAEVQYVDAGPTTRTTGKTDSLGGQFYVHMDKADALLHVVRVFADERVPHIQGSVNPERDISIMNVELAFSDLVILEKRLQKLEPSLKAARPGERDALLKEHTLLSKIKQALETDIPIREQQLSEEEKRLVSGFQFLSAKPLLLVANIGEESLPLVNSMEKEWQSRYTRTNQSAAVICGKLEMELTQLNEAEANEFRESLGLQEAALDRMVKLSYELLGLISFFTVVSDEIRAWSIRKDTPAIKAAGKVHSDMEKGFIRAEVVSYDDLVSCGSIAEAKKKGLVHIEGKNYNVKDGDTITFLFNL